MSPIELSWTAKNKGTSNQGGSNRQTIFFCQPSKACPENVTCIDGIEWFSFSFFSDDIGEKSANDPNIREIGSSHQDCLRMICR